MCVLALLVCTVCNAASLLRPVWLVGVCVCVWSFAAEPLLCRSQQRRIEILAGKTPPG